MERALQAFERSYEGAFLLLDYHSVEMIQPKALLIFKEYWYVFAGAKANSFGLKP